MRNEQEQARDEVVDLGVASQVTRGGQGNSEDIFNPRALGVVGLSDD